MLSFPGYRLLENIHKGHYSEVYRAIRLEDELPVILKVLLPIPSFDFYAKRYKQDFEICRALNLPQIVTPYELKTHQHHLILVLEDFGGQPVSQFLRSRKLSLQELLELSIKATETLEAIHQQHVIHKDIKSSNFIINFATGSLKLTDFGISTLLHREIPPISHPDELPGTLSYMSPEQTGRMNRSVDYRTDFYSLGITFYEWFSGHPPFESSDPMEIVHCHLAMKPASLHAKDSGIPSILNEIVQKLLAKNAEDRYQSASGLKTDLQHCAERYRKIGTVEPFPLGTSEMFTQFRIPEKLYGRERELEQVLDLFERVGTGRKEVLFCTGAAGIGKSALLNELHRPVVAQRGYFIRGKYDLFQRNIPYSAILEAFQTLIHQILAESDECLQLWKQRLLEQLGQNAQVMIDVLPDLELVVGSQPRLQVLPPTELQNRFHTVCRNFVKVFAKAEHPLVLFLDDLQWADRSSMHLLKAFVNDPELHHVLFLGAYRDNEVDTRHPMSFLLKDLAKEGCLYTELHLPPLSPESISRMLEDTLNSPAQRHLGLATLVHVKTAGNPFFVLEFLQSLYRNKLLRFRREWNYDLSRIQEAEITENVVELMRAKIRTLCPGTWWILKIAACIGFEFDMATLGKVAGQNEDELFRDIKEAFDEGIIVKIEKEARFIHDRVSEAAHALISGQELEAIHFRIAETLLADPALPEKKLFHLADHLNFAKALLDRERKRLAVELNLKAGKRAKASAAYTAAVNFFRHAEEMLPENAWNSAYQMTLELYTELAEAEYMALNYEAAERLFDEILQHTLSVLDRAKVYRLMIRYDSKILKLQEAIDLAVEILNEFGIPFRDPRTITPQILQEELSRFQRALNGRAVSDLAALPEVNNPVYIEALEILTSILVPFWNIYPGAFAYPLFEMAQISMKHGLNSSSADGLSTLGSILCEQFKLFTLGYELGELALQIQERFQEKFHRSMILFLFYNMTYFWKQPLRWGREFLLEGYHEGVAFGNNRWASYCLNHYCMRLLWIGEALDTTKEEFETYAILSETLKQEDASLWFNTSRQCVYNLLGEVKDPFLLTGIAFDEEEALRIYSETQSYSGIGLIYIHKLLLFTVFGEFGQALDLLADEQAEYCIRANSGHFQRNIGLCLLGVSLMQNYEQLSAQEQQRCLEKTRELRDEFRSYAETCPVNFSAMQRLLAAEIHRVTGEEWQAIEAYDQAIKAARDGQLLHFEAIAHELAAAFWLKKEKTAYAQMHIREAYRCYQAWGAKPKIRQMEIGCPELTIHPPQITGGDTTSKGLDHFDLNTVLKAYQVLAREIDLSSLITHLMRLTLENAGARKGCVLLERDGRFCIEGLASTEPWEIEVLQSRPFEAAKDLPLNILRYVLHSGESVVLDNAAEHGQFTQDPYVREHQLKSVLCTTIRQKERLAGILYVENNLMVNVFTEARIEVLNLLLSQTAVSLENAELFEERRQAEAALKKSEERYRQLNIELEQQVRRRTARLEDKNNELKDFAYIVSHDLRAPLRGINQLAHWLVQDYGEKFDEAGRELIELLTGRVKRMDHLITDLLEYSRVGRIMGEMEELDLSVLLKNILDSLAPPSNIYISIESDFPELYAERTRIVQVFQHLLSNAIKFMDKAEGRIRIICEERGCDWKFRIADNGPGIDPKYHEKIFQIFQTLQRKDNSESTGIGLALVKKIVENYGGRVWLESQEGEGSEFMFTLPKEGGRHDV